MSGKGKVTMPRVLKSFKKGQRVAVMYNESESVGTYVGIDETMSKKEQLHKDALPHLVQFLSHVTSVADDEIRVADSEAVRRTKKGPVLTVEVFIEKGKLLGKFDILLKPEEVLEQVEEINEAIFSHLENQFGRVIDHEL